jgi:hypothetical protein
MTRYSINGTEFAANSPLFQAALEGAYKNRIRPICLCVEPGLPMYIAHLEKNFVVKRMPDTGASHGPGCESYEAPPGLSGRGEVDGQAIENNDQGTTNLKLAFSLRHNNPAEKENESTQKTTAKTSGTRLTLRGLLHYLWDESRLSHWSPEMQGKRSWFAVRSALMEAVESKETKSASLKEILYIPEVFDKAKRNDIVSRRLHMLSPIMGPGKSGKKLMLVVGEMDSISAATFGFALRLKHMPDFPLVMDADLKKSFEKVFLGTQNLWDYIPDSHQVVIATFVIDDKGIPAVEEMCVMCTTPEWLPVDNEIEHQLIEALVEQKRSFQKQLRYNLPPDKPIATAVLTDCGNAPLALYIDIDDLVGRWASTVAINEVVKSNSIQTWMWVPRDGVQPDLPPKMGMPSQPRQQARLADEEQAEQTPLGDSAGVSEPTVVGAAQPGGSDDILTDWGEPAVPAAFQPKRGGNVTVMPVTSPRLAEVTPIRPSLPDVSLIPFKPGFGLTGHQTFTEVLSLGEVDVDTSTKA